MQLTTIIKETICIFYTPCIFNVLFLISPISLLDPTADAVQKLMAKCPTEYVMELQRKIAAIHHLARERMGQAALKQEKGYNNRLHK